MKRRDEKNLDDYRDGLLSERERARIEADPELSEQLSLNMGLGSLVKEAWTEGPPAPSPEYLISALRPAMARIDAEIEAASPWNRMRERISEWLTPAPVAALVGAAALVMLAVLPDTGGEVTPGMVSGDATAAAEAPIPAQSYAPEPRVNIDVQTVATNPGATAGPSIEPKASGGSSVYDLGQGKNPLMLFESEDATVIWVLPSDGVSLRSTRGGWV